MAATAEASTILKGYRREDGKVVINWPATRAALKSYWNTECLQGRMTNPELHAMTRQLEDTIAQFKQEVRETFGDVLVEEGK